MKTLLINENFREKYCENLLRSRGVVNIESFLHPTEACLQDAEDLDNVEKGAELLKITLTLKKPILIVVDCDCDGYTSAAIIHQYIRRFAPDIVIDHILHEGKQHGLEDCWEKIPQSKIEYGLVILPDSSSNDYEYHEKLKAINLPCLVLDHHLAEGPFSNNAVIINNQLSPRYQNKELTGAGVTYQFCKYLDDFFHVNYAKNYIDLAALGIIGDMGSMADLENRYFVYEGLSHINNFFFRTLAEKQAYSITKISGADWKEVQTALNPISVAFYIVPLINAMIRIGTMEEKERMFLAFVDGLRKVVSHKRGAKGALERVAVESTRECVNARTHQNKIKDEAVGRIEAKIFKYDLLENQILFVRLDDDDDFPAVLNGLVAMQLAAQFKRPTIVARLNDEGMVRGSIRGLNESEFNYFKSYLTDTGLCEYVQGHENAAGISIPDSNLRKLHEKANVDLARYNFTEDLYEVNFVRFAADPDLEALIKDISKYNNIWGTGNDIPKIYVKDINITKADVQVMGKTGDAVKFTKFGISYVKTYGAKDLIQQLNEFDEMKIEVVGEANLNEWCGQVTPQIMIKSVEVHDGRFGF